MVSSICAALPQGGITFGNHLPNLQAPIFGPELDWVNFGGNSAYGAIAGVSALFTADIGSAATGLRSFGVGWLDAATLAPHVPEPSAISLLPLGGGLWFFHRSRNVRS